MTACCYVCGTTEDLVETAPHNFACRAHRVAGEHVVSMQTRPGGSAVAVCQCGWRSEATGKGRMVIREAKVRAHWHTMIRAAARALADDVRANIVLVVFASVAASAAFGSWLGGVAS